MTHPDLMMAIARDRIDDLRQSAGSGAREHKSRQHVRKLSQLLAHRRHRPLVRNGSRRHRSAPRRLDGIERVNHELLRSR